MPNSPPVPTVRLAVEASDPSEIDESGLAQQVAACQHRIAELEVELESAADQEAAAVQRVDTERSRRVSLDQQLHEAREEAARSMLDEATQEAAALVAEAEEFLEASRIEAERKADKITKQAFDQAREMLSEAKDECEATMNAGREELGALEADAAERVADLDTEHRELTQRLRTMETVYNELRDTLQLVAETSVKELVETQESVRQLDPAETEEPPPEPSSEQTTSDSAPGDGPVTNLETTSASDSDEPATIDIPLLTDR